MVYVYLFFLITGWTIFTKYKEREEINFYNVLDSFEKHSEGVNPPPPLNRDRVKSKDKFFICTFRKSTKFSTFESCIAKV